MYNFARIGVAGYVAPRHLKAIRDRGNNLAVAVDSRGSVGILESCLSLALFFTERPPFAASFQ